MSYTNVIPGPEQALHLRYKSINNPTPEHISRISFSSHVTESRLISINKQFGPHRPRSMTQVHSLYAPADTRETLYEVLGITDSGSSTSFSDIKKAYKSMARKYHPDVSPPDRVDEHARRFIIVHEAYQTLSDPETRALYDKDLARGLRFGISPRGTGEHDQRMEEKGGWKISWQSQLDELKQRNVNKDSRGNMSWGARMRNQRL